MGRPLVPIDWERVEYLIECGCSGPEIAAYFSITAETLYERTVKEYGQPYSTISQGLRCKGDSVLREAQHKKASSGDNTMLVWLGKNRLEQRDTPLEVSVSGETAKNFGAMMKQLQDAQANFERNIADIKSKAESKS